MQIQFLLVTDNESMEKQQHYSEIHLQWVPCQNGTVSCGCFLILLASLAMHYFHWYALSNKTLSNFNEPLTRYAKLRVLHAPGMPGMFSPRSGVSDPAMHHGKCVTQVPCCMPESLTSTFLWSRCWGKRSRHSLRMRNPQFCVSGKRPMTHWSSITVSTWSQHASSFNSSIPGKLADNLADDIFKGIFLNEDIWISINISLNFVRKDPMDGKPAFVQVMAWRRTSNKPLPEPMITSFINAYMRHYGEMR